MLIWSYTIISVFIVSIISLIGVFTLSLKKDLLQKVIFMWVSFAVGALLGDAFIHLIPHTFAELGAGMRSSFLILGGIILFFMLEKFVRWRHCHDGVCEGHNKKPVVVMNIVGDAVHNFIDGALIAASYLVSIPIGIATTVAVVLHEIPQEIGDFAVLVYGGYSVARALLVNFLVALTAVGGAVIALVIGQSIENFALWIIPITAGGFIYIAGSDLIPELHHDNKLATSLNQFVFIILGIAIMFSLTLLEH